MAAMCVCGVALTGCGGNSDNSKEETPPSTENVEQTTTQEQQAEQVEGLISYEFTGKEADKAGYAQGTITFTAPEKGNYSLYWSDDNGALDGYYAIAQLELDVANASESISFGYHTAIPADATKVIAVANDKGVCTVEAASAVYEIPQEKQLGYRSADALDYVTKMDVDFIVSSGDQVTNFIRTIDELL